MYILAYHLEIIPSLIFCIWKLQYWELNASFWNPATQLDSITLQFKNYQFVYPLQSQKHSLDTDVGAAGVTMHYGCQPPCGGWSSPKITTDLQTIENSPPRGKWQLWIVDSKKWNYWWAMWNQIPSQNNTLCKFQISRNFPRLSWLVYYSLGK